MSKAKDAGQPAAFLDIRAIGSNGSYYSDDQIPSVERGLRLVIDVLQALHDELLAVAVERIGGFLDPSQVTIRIDDFASAISEVRLFGSAEKIEEVVTHSGSAGEISAKFGFSSAAATVDAGGSVSSRSTADSKTTVRTEGREVRAIDFSRTQISLSGLLKILGVEKFWLFLDEWSEIPREVQPYLADLVRKTLLPVQGIVIKIAAIEQRSAFILQKESGEYIGLELGADIGADLNLDEFLVFDYNEEKAKSFFQELIFRNYLALGGSSGVFRTSGEFASFLFTEKRAFEEFVRAVEGVPRDALNLISKAVTKSYGSKISVEVVRKAALDWYQADKVNVVNSSSDLSRALNHIIDEVIGQRRARAFLFPSNYRHLVVDRLYDARILHLLKKNISSRDEPGRRYDAWKIDYGCYVDLIRTQKAPLGLLPDENGFVDVPSDDYRSIRRAVLSPDDLDRFSQ